MDLLNLDEYNTTVVTNDYESINELGFFLVLKSIFKKQDELDRIVSLLKNMSGFSNSSYENILNFLKNLIIDKIKTENVNSLYISMYNSLLTHELETNDNRRAYSEEIRQFPSAVSWPNPVHDIESKRRSLFDEIPIAKEFKFIDKKTPVGSLGSCFAMEIAIKLQQDGYNYVITEDNLNFDRGGKYHISCAKWGTVFNTPSFRQLIEKSFGIRKLPRILWNHHDSKGIMSYRDPFREEIDFKSIEEYELNYETHRLAAREAFMKCKVFIFTLGLNEVWFLKSDGAAFSRSPWRIASYLVEKKVLSVEENIKELQKALDILRIYNPEIKLILTVSPVPLMATFRADDYHVITANEHSKATLRVVAEEFVNRNKNVYYFPSYETVMHCTRDAWDEDQRHVSKNAVKNVMNLFEKIFVKEEILTEEEIIKTEIEISNFIKEKNYIKAELESIKIEKYMNYSRSFNFNLGLINLNLFKYDTAILYFEKALELGLLNKELFFNIALCLEKIGDKENSDLFYEKANEL